MDKKERITIFEQTISCANEWKYTNNIGEEQILLKKDYGMSFDDAKLYDRDMSPEIKQLTDIPHNDTEITVENRDCLYVACSLIDEGYNPAVLNMASFKRPGGGVKNGSAAQEESLCRRTNLYKSISRFDNLKLRHRYPLDINHGAIYSPVISVFRLSESEDCQFMNRPYTIDVISAAAIKNPNLENGHLDKKTRKILRNKIRAILNLGIYYRNDSLVLGAFGCGAYGTPPEDMAKLFADVLSLEPYKGAFKKIVFAVLDDANAYREHNPEGNYIPFKRIFEK